jgi:hypothetical protein
MGMKVNGTSGLTFPDTTTLASAGQASVRAWVNFNGTGTVAIRASFNVSSITDNGTGNYTVNFTTAMPDANYAAVASRENTTDQYVTEVRIVTLLSSSARFLCVKNGAETDVSILCVAIFR